MANHLSCTCLVVGGGIAGVSCAENLNFLAPECSIILLTESPLIKAVSNLVQLGKCLQRFEVEERDATSMNSNRIKVIHDQLVHIETERKQVRTESGSIIGYGFLCICTGARPKLISHNNPLVIGIRDTDSAIEFQRHIKNGQRVLVVGNGGIASEVVYETKGIQVDWVVKDNHISSTFVDPGAAHFFQDRLQVGHAEEEDVKPIVKRMRYAEAGDTSQQLRKGAALGPDWHRMLDITGSAATQTSDRVKIHYNCEVQEIVQGGVGSEYPLQVQLTNGEMISCDFVVSATGVDPSVHFTTDVPLKLGPDGGIAVDELMRTSAQAVYAAGDCCYTTWAQATHWFQMRLWTQARQMGAMAAKSIAGVINGDGDVLQDFCFELFGHVTQLFGYQVVLLGLYNGQKLNNQYEMLVRVTPGKEYVKFILKDGRLQGAILIGETGLEETCENLILNQLDLTPYGDDILNPNIDIEDYFD